MIHANKEAGEIGETKLSHFDEAESLLEKLMDLKAHFFPAERVIKRQQMRIKLLSLSSVSVAALEFQLLPRIYQFL